MKQILEGISSAVHETLSVIHSLDKWVNRTSEYSKRRYEGEDGFGFPDRLMFIRADREDFITSTPYGGFRPQVGEMVRISGNVYLIKHVIYDGRDGGDIDVHCLPVELKDHRVVSVESDQDEYRDYYYIQGFRWCLTDKFIEKIGVEKAINYCAILIQREYVEDGLIIPRVGEYFLPNVNNMYTCGSVNAYSINEDDDTKIERHNFNKDEPFTYTKAYLKQWVGKECHQIDLDNVVFKVVEVVIKPDAWSQFVARLICEIKPKYEHDFIQALVFRAD